MNLRKLVPRYKFEFAKTLRKNMTIAERKFWDFVKHKKLGYRFKRQNVIRGYIVDFYCGKLKIVVEIDGSSHLDRQYYDIKRQGVLESVGMNVVRFSNDEIIKDFKNVEIKLRSLLHAPC